MLCCVHALVMMRWRCVDDDDGDDDDDDDDDADDDVQMLL